MFNLLMNATRWVDSLIPLPILDSSIFSVETCRRHINRLETGEVFCDKLRQIYIELPYFIKDEDECETDFERWIYVLKNMEILERMPFKGRKAVFDRLEQMTSKANMTVAERQQYEEEWKNANDYYNTLDYAKKEAQAEGRAEGCAEERIRQAKGFKEQGFPIASIAQVTGLSVEEIEEL